MIENRVRALPARAAALGLVLFACGDATDGGAASDANAEPRGDSASTEGTASRGDPIENPTGGLPGTPGVPPEAPPPPFTEYDVNHVLFTGQSNSVANSGTPVLSLAQPFDNVMFDGGVMPAAQCDGSGCKTYAKPSGFVPLVEGDRFFDYAVETPSAGLANQATFLASTKYASTTPTMNPRHRVLVTLHGRSGNTYWCLRRGGCNYKPGYVPPFEQAMLEVGDARAIASANGQSYVVRAVAAVHGESDHYSYTDGSQEFPIDGSDGTPGKIQTYADGLIEWQADYETAVRGITGQKEPVPLLVSQISGWNDTAYSKVAQYQLEAHEKAHGKVVLVGPSYALSFSSDCRHFTNEGERRLGEYFGKVYARMILERRAWEPVRPKSVTRDGSVLTVVFHVPVPPLAIDTERVAPAANYGFDYVEGGLSKPIANVEVSGPDTVRITLAAPAAAGGRLLYAQNQVPLTCIGSPVGARGNLRDSDETRSQSGYDLHNWSVHFDAVVP